MQRKICNILLFNALDRIKQQEIFEISIKRLCSLIGYNSNDIALIKKSLKSLISIVLEWNLLEKDKINPATDDLNVDNINNTTISWHASSLLAGASIENGLVKYAYSPQIKSILASLEIYGRINLFIQAKFNSSYSLVLYENCVRFKNINQTCWFNVDLFRSLMGVQRDKYPSFKEFKRNVITTAVNEINKKADIKIEPEYRHEGRRVVAIRFLIGDNEGYFPSLKKKRTDNLAQAFVASSDIYQELVRTLGLKSHQAKQFIADYEPKYLKTKLAMIMRTKAYKDGQIDNMNAYLHTVLQQGNAQKATNAVDFSKRSTVSDKVAQASTQRISTLEKKYTQYKVNLFLKHLKQLPENIRKALQKDYQHYLVKNHPTLVDIYHQKGFTSVIVAYNYIEFVEQEAKNYVPNYLSYEDFITAEEDELAMS